MTVCLQGGGEFSPACREMDAAVLARVDGPVVVTALAGAVGREYATATANGVAHYRALGADVRGAPDVRTDPDGALAALRSARLVVLPGGSPSRLLDALRATPVGQLVVDLVADGGAVSGASAGAMVLCAWTVLPEGPGGPRAVPGLGVVRGAVVPHWTPAGRPDWLAALRAAAPDGLRVLGLPEESGVLVADGEDRPVGRSPVQLVDTWRGDEEQDPLSSERPGGG
jgi:cyanophycinase-like exopeptidase